MADKHNTLARTHLVIKDLPIYDTTYKGIDNFVNCKYYDYIPKNTVVLINIITTEQTMFGCNTKVHLSIKEDKNFDYTCVIFDEHYNDYLIQGKAVETLYGKN